MEQSERTARLKELERISRRRRLTVAELDEIAAHFDALGQNAKAADARGHARRRDDPDALAATDEVDDLFGSPEPAAEAAPIAVPAPAPGAPGPIPPASGPGPARGLTAIALLLVILAVAAVAFLVGRRSGEADEAANKLAEVPSAAELQAQDEQAQILLMLTRLQELVASPPPYTLYRAALTSADSALRGYRSRQPAEKLQETFWTRAQSTLAHHQRAATVWFEATDQKPETLGPETLLTDPERVSEMQDRYPNAPFVYREAVPAKGDTPAIPAGWTVPVEPLLKQIWQASERDLNEARQAR